MSKAFTKGQFVTLIRDWDRKGTVYFRHAVVYSCGKKQMVLTDVNTGEEIGRHFKPEAGNFEWGGVFLNLTDEEAIRVGLNIAENILTHQREHYARCLSGGHGEGYNDAIRKGLSELHEPRCDSHANLCALIKCK